MKQVIEVKICVTLDYDHPDVLHQLKDEMVESGLTADQVRQKVRESLVSDLKEAADSVLSECDQGMTYTVWDVEAEV